MIVKRKTRKAIRKSVNKALKKHGPKIAAGLAGGHRLHAGDIGQH